MSGQKKLTDSGPGWPSFPAKRTLPGLLDGLKVSQWWPAPDLDAAQQVIALADRSAGWAGVA